MDISKLKIDTSKMLANGDEYFGLYEKHIPRGLGKDKLVLVYEILNLDCIIQIIGLNPEAGYIVVGNDASNQALKFFIDKKTNVQYLNSLELEDCNMKFDCIIMNPPYSKNLHLKILAKAISHLKDDNSIVVNLSPVRWLQDPLAKYKKNCDLKRFEESVAKHIKSLEVVTRDATNELFDIDTGLINVYVCNTQQHDFINKYVDNNINSAFKKIAEMIATRRIGNVKDHVVYDDMSGIACITTGMVYAVRDRDIRMNNGWLSQSREVLFYTDKKNDTTGETYLQYRTKVAWGNLKPKAENLNVKFNSKKERDNFYNSWRLKLLRWYYDMTLVDVHVYHQFLPWLGDITNPRTGLKGYQGEWTDDDLYKLFGINEDEQKIIEDTMKKYK